VSRLPGIADHLVGNSGVGQVQVRGAVVAQPGGALVTPGALVVRRPVAERVGERPAEHLADRRRPRPPGPRSLSRLPPWHFGTGLAGLQPVRSLAVAVEGGIGPVPVTRQAAALVTPGWRVTIVLAEQSGGWEMAEVVNVNVYP
jgi:hypothetical protein